MKNFLSRSIERSIERFPTSRDAVKEIDPKDEAWQDKELEWEISDEKLSLSFSTKTEQQRVLTEINIVFGGARKVIQTLEYSQTKVNFPVDEEEPIHHFEGDLEEIGIINLTQAAFNLNEISSFAKRHSN